MTPHEPETLPLTVEAPADLEAGVYANTLSTWFTATDVTVDFAAVLPSELVTTDRGEAVLPRARLVSRVRMPPSQARELVTALSEALSRHDRQFGPGGGPGDLWTV